MCHHKAPHRTWEPSSKHFTMYDDIDIPEPRTLWDDHEGRADVVKAMEIRIMDLDPIIDLKALVPQVCPNEMTSAGDISGTSRTTSE